MPNYKCENFRHDTLDATGECKLVFCGLLTDEVQWQERWHKHGDACELVLVVQGTGIACINDQQFPFAKGDLIAYNDGVVHTEQILSANEPLSLLYAVLTNVSLRGMKDNELVPRGMSPVIPTGKNYSGIKNLLEMIYEECKHQDIGYERVVQGMAQALLMLATRLANDQYQLMLNGSSSSLEKQIREYLEVNCTKNLSLKAIAQHFHISHFYLEHLFKQRNGVSPICYLIRYKMDKAAHLLESTNISIKTIAITFGYENSTYFSLAFKKNKGITPASYRKLHQKAAQ